ncbi:MAG: hypothetical protein ACOC3D_13545, partial [Pseudomonadota bacterium]
MRLPPAEDPLQQLIAWVEALPETPRRGPMRWGTAGCRAAMEPVERARAHAQLHPYDPAARRRLAHALETAACLCAAGGAEATATAALAEAIATTRRSILEFRPLPELIEDLARQRASLAALAAIAGGDADTQPRQRCTRSAPGRHGRGGPSRG